jgi:hypothetical protein
VPLKPAPLRLVLCAGDRFGRLVAIKSVFTGRGGWLCQCDCGKRCVVQANNLARGGTISCGCKKNEARHGHASRAKKDPTYETWVNMKQRCTNPGRLEYRYYGGRGIRVCERWSTSYETFLADMGPRPPRKTIDRINNDGNYEPGNCRWATQSEQVRNQRRRG